MVLVIILAILGVLALLSAFLFWKFKLFGVVVNPVIVGLVALCLFAGSALAWVNHDDSSPKAQKAKVTKEKGKSQAHAKDDLGPFNPASYTEVETAPLGEIGPGACLPAHAFDNPNGQEQVVAYLSGQDSRDTEHTHQGVVRRDESWLAAHASYYQYSGQGDVGWHKGNVLAQLPYAITVTNTYCPAGQNTVVVWKVQTLPKGEWVWFRKGHAPGDKTNLIPVRKAGCGNFLLPPPAKPKPPTPKPKPTTTTTVARKPKPTTTVPAPTTTTTRPVVTTTTTSPPSTSTTLGRKGTPATTTPPPPTTSAPPATSPPTTTAGSPTTVQAGPGATNTSAPPTTIAPAPAPPTTSSPSTTPPPPPP